MKKTNNKFSRSHSLALLCLLTLLGGAGVVAKTGGVMLAKRAPVAAGRPKIKVALAGFVARDDKQMSLDEAKAVRTGEVITWTIDSTNDSTAPAHNYSTVGKIPAGTSFVAGSATSASGATVTYSIDNGKTYSAAPTIQERQADGSVKQVLAPVAMYTQVRYEWSDPLAANAKNSTTYKVRVR